MTKARKRPARLRKTRPAARKRLADRLWRAFAAYVKRRDGPTCISCKKGGLSGQNWHAGHLFSSNRSPAVRYDPKNVHSQCAYCNAFLRGNAAAYAEAVISAYGLAEFQRLAGQSRVLKQWREPELGALLDALKRGDAEFEMYYAETYVTRPDVEAAIAALEAERA